MSTIGFKYKPSEKARSIGGGQEVCACLSSETHDAAVAFCYDGYNQRGHKEVSMTLRSAMTGTEGNDADPKVAYGINPVMSGVMMETKPAEETAQTLRKSPGGENGVVQSLGFKYKQSEKSQKPFAENGESQALSSGCHDSAVAIGFKAGQSKDGGLGDEREVSPTLSHQPSALEPTVAQSTFVRIGSMTRRDRPTPPSEEVAHALTKTDGDAGDNAASVVQSLAAMRYIVRRLTPKEAERLMGLPQEPAIRIGEMTNDEYVAFELQQGNIAVDFNTGYVYSMRRHRGKRSEPHRLEGTDIRGYIHHKIVDGKQRRNCRAHRIVWIAANGIPPEGMVIDHINNNKSDNRLCNLQMLTPEDNSHKAHDDGLYLCGDDNPASKLTEEERNEIRLLYATGAYSYSQLANKYNVSKARIAQLARTVGYTIPAGLDANDPALVAEFQRTFDTFNAIMADYAHKPAPKPKSAKQVADWLKKISDPATCPDSPRYKGCGNGWATNQPRWILTRLLYFTEQENTQTTQTTKEKENT